MQKMNYKMIAGLLGIFLGLSSMVYGGPGPRDFWKRKGNDRAYQARDIKDLKSRTSRRVFTSRHCKGSNQLETCYFSELDCSTKTCELGWSCVEPNKGEATCADPSWITTACTDPYHVKTMVKGGPLNNSWVTPCPVYPTFKTFCVDGQCTSETPPCIDNDGTKFISIAPEEGSLGAGSPQLANGDKSDQIPSTVTFAGFDLPDKCKGNHLEEMICRNKQGQIAPASIGVDCTLSAKICLEDEQGKGFCGEEDLCPDVAGKQPVFLYDSNGDGKVDSCVPSENDDKCPGPDVPGIQLDYPYDSDGDGKNDSCVPSEKDDKCPDVPGIQLDYLFDLDGDGKKDSCDLCPDLAGNQQAFPFDTDGDGVKDSCNPVKDDFCTNPTKPDGCTLYQYNDLWHLGCCLADQPKTLLHIICAKNGKWAQSTTTCEGGDAFVCKEGACLEKTCNETDLGVDWEHYGEVTADHLNKEEYWQPHEEAQDHCGGKDYFSGQIKDVKTATDFSNSAQVETSCDLEDTDKNGSLINQEVQSCAVGTFCVDMDQDGKKIFGCQPLKCDDPDGQDFDTYGTTTLKIVVNGVESTLATYADSCSDFTSKTFNSLQQSTDEVSFGGHGDYRKEYFCNADGVVDFKEQPCDLGTYCVEKETGGKKVLGCEPATCVDSDNGIDWKIQGKVSGLGLGGDPYEASDRCFKSGKKDFKIEMYCEKYYGGMTAEQKMEACPEGESCAQDSKIGEPPHCVPSVDIPPPPAKCNDLDNGINWNEVSTTWYGPFHYDDDCTQDHTQIQEGYCDADGKLAFAYQDCGAGAVCVKSYDYDKNGKSKAKLECQEMGCFDSDGGINWDTVGTTTYLGTYTQEEKTDTCWYGDTKVEYYCKDGKLDHLEEKCPEGTTCNVVGTKIICKGICDESDKDNDPYTFGTVYTPTNPPYPDYCAGNIVYQYRCNELGEKDEAPFYDCAQDGATCKEGACVKK